MKAYLFTTFSKRKNSTKRPNKADGTLHNVVMKKSTSLESPTFEIQNVALNVSYMYLEDANMYYFVDDIVLGNNNIYELHCSQDILASHKEDILNTTAFISYAQTGYNSQIADKRLSTVSQPTMTVSEDSVAVLAGWDSEGTYIVEASSNVSNDLLSAQFGTTLKYAMNQEYMRRFSYEINHPTTSTEEEIKKSILSVYDAIHACRWLPIANSQYNNGLVSDGFIFIGGAAIPTPQWSWKLMTINSSYGVTYHQIPIPWQYSDWRNESPYTTGILILPYYGAVELNINDYVGYTNLYMSATIDKGTGDIVYKIYAPYDDGSYDDKNIMSIYLANISIDIPLSTTQNDAIGGATAELNMGTSLTSALFSLDVLGGISTWLQGSFQRDLAYNQRKVTNVVYGKGSVIMSLLEKTTASIILFSHNTNVSPSSVADTIGCPLMADDRIGNHTGYIQTSNASVNLNGFGNDRDAINSLLNGGVYIE